MEPPSPYSIAILNESGREVDPSKLTRVALIALADGNFPPGDLSLLLTSSEAVRDLNLRFRGIDSATDVLTFPPSEMPIVDENRPLGDVAISVAQAEVQAKSRSISLDDEISYLAIHGILHLSGRNDESDVERQEMISEMERVGQLAGLAPIADWHTLAPMEAVS
ncbi:MAG TPA: rRNA maturation RNase YbeY [Fimbriimonadaceae bacterium]|nr:rRNA maturation RNase YbeY [Fimbriimonadaceae bacterium]